MCKNLFKSCIVFVVLFAISNASVAGMKAHELALAKSAMDKSGISASKSISLVQQQFAGVVYDYELDTDDDLLIHQIKLIDIEDDLKRKITISAISGEVLEVEESKLHSWFYEDDSVVAVKKLLKLNFSLAESMPLIRLPIDGFFSDIELEDKHGIVYFEVETFSGEGEQEVLLNAESRAVIPVFQR